MRKAQANAILDWAIGKMHSQMAAILADIEDHPTVPTVQAGKSVLISKGDRPLNKPKDYPFVRVSLFRVTELSPKLTAGMGGRTVQDEVYRLRARVIVSHPVPEVGEFHTHRLMEAVANCIEFGALDGHQSGISVVQCEAREYEAGGAYAPEEGNIHEGLVTIRITGRRIIPPL